MNRKPLGYWTKELYHETALKCDSRSEFQKKYSGAYQAAYSNGWLDEICPHMRRYKPALSFQS